ncbi:MAG: DNA polymerase Y family protein [Gammaproteobacteria bacterium]|nr:DNA polymerase Y family protein [Gammaproteobacteria bacterium]
MLWFGLYLPHLPLEVFKQPSSTTGVPIVVTDAQRVVRENDAARAAGIRLGASLATARSLAPALVHHARNREIEAQRLERLVSTAYAFTPYVSVAAGDALLLDMAGSLKLFDGIHKARSKLRKKFGRAGHRVAIGVAHTPRASLAFAKSGMDVAWPDMPDPQTIRRITLQLLDTTPLASLDLAPKTLERFVNMGMRKVGDIVHVPRHEVVKRFGVEIADCLAELTGERMDPWNAERPPESFSESLHLIEPLRGKDEVLEPMEHLAKLLATWLARLNFGVRRLSWGVYTFDGEGASFEVGFEQPRHEVADIMAITRLQMETVDLPGEAMTITLDVLYAMPLSAKWVERDVLGQTVAQPAPPRELVERLSARLGKDALQRFCIFDDHRPEFAWRPTAERDAGKAPIPVPERGRRPLWLLEPPMPMRADHLRIVSGPERIRCGWWEQEQCRDYFVAQDRDATWCWCFRDAQGWFVHGYFA